MANVLIRDVPDEVVNDLKKIAKHNNRPLQQELRDILVRTSCQPYRDIARRAREIRQKLSAKQQLFTDSSELVREDRNR